MKSPFPGMDPYIEACGLWEDFHTHLVAQISDTLAEAAPPQYLVRAGERSYVVLVDSEEFIEETFREAFVDIYTTTPEQRLVTCIEVLSPSNKRAGSPGWDLYQRKRQGVMLAGVNLVEIDLPRRGERMPMVDSWPNSPYVLLVARAFRESRCKVWRASFQTRLPSIPVPLASPDPDLTLDLQPMIDSIYRRFRYARTIDYQRPLSPRLTAAESAWFKQRLKHRS